LGNRIYNAPLRGRAYETDAFQVLQTLRQWTLGGLAETFVNNNNDVQVAWANLIRNYEGHDAHGINIQRAREILINAHWVRNTHNFTFDDYCNKFIKANAELYWYRGNVDPASQVAAFLKGVQTNPCLITELIPIKAIILNWDNTKENLANAIITFKDTMRQMGVSFNN
jgi:hypothetical protein